MDGDKQSNRSHRPSKTGNKAEKKGTAKAKPDRGQNPKVSHYFPVQPLPSNELCARLFFFRLYEGFALAEDGWGVGWRG